MRLPLPDLGKLKDYGPEMLAIENIEANSSFNILILA